MTLRLHGYFRSSCSWRVRIALAYKAVEAESVSVHLVRDGGQQHGEPHLARNPMAQVPVLEVNGEPIGQSMAILEYLEEAYPSPSLLPGTALQRAHCRQIAECINAGVQPLQNLAVMQRLQREHGWSKQEAVAWSRTWIADGLRAVEVLVNRVGGRYCVGDSLSLADLCLVPQMYNARRFGVDLEPLPQLSAIDEALHQLDVVSATHPHRQDDTPPELKEP